MGIEGLTIEIPAGTIECMTEIDTEATITLDRGPVIEVECIRHGGQHTGHVELTEILPYL